MKIKLTMLFILLLFSTFIYAQNNLIITEIMFDVPPDSLGDANGDGVRGSHSDEFVEFYNRGTDAIDLAGYQIIEREGVVVFTFPIGATINPQQFAVVFGAIGTAGLGSNLPSDAVYFAVNENDDNNDGFNNGLGKSNFSNSGDRVMLVNPLLADTIAEVYWQSPTSSHTVTPFTADAIFLGPPNTVSGDSLYGPIRESVTRDINSNKWDLNTYVTSDPNNLFSPGKNSKENLFHPSPVILTEIMFDVPSDTLGDANGDGHRGSHSDEFIELYNTGIKSVDLTGYQLLDKLGVPVFRFPAGESLEPGQFAVVFGAVGTNGVGANIPPDTKVFAVNWNDDNNDGFDNGQGNSNFSNKGDAVLLVDSLQADTVKEIYWGSALPQTSKAIYLGPPNTISGDSISGAIKQSVTRKIDNPLWDLHTVVSTDSNSFFSPGLDAPKPVVINNSDLIVTEIMFDVPPDSILGDANGDGIRGSHSDEFVELYNRGTDVINLSGYQILDATGLPVYTFPNNAAINSKQFAVVFGAIGTAGLGSSLPSDAVYFAVNENDDNNDGFDNGAGRTNFSQSGDAVIIVNPAQSDTITEIYWGTATPLTSKAFYLGFPNTVSGTSISGNIDQSVTRQLGSDLWDKHTVVTNNSNSLFSPGKDAEKITDVKFNNMKPISFKLKQNYPNPFNPSTIISFSLPSESNVDLKIYNILGKEVTELVKKELTPGNYSYSWDASNFASGVYFYRIQAGNFIQTKKMLLIK